MWFWTSNSLYFFFFMFVHVGQKKKICNIWYELALSISSLSKYIRQKARKSLGMSCVVQVFLLTHPVPRCYCWLDDTSDDVLLEHCGSDTHPWSSMLKSRSCHCFLMNLLWVNKNLNTHTKSACPRCLSYWFVTSSVCVLVGFVLHTHACFCLWIYVSFTERCIGLRWICLNALKWLSLRACVCAC